MKLKIYVLTASIAGMLSVIAAFIDYRISLGLLLSAGVSLFHMWLLSLSMKAMMKKENGNYAAMAAGNVIRFLLLLAVVYVGVKNTQLFTLANLLKIECWDTNAPALTTRRRSSSRRHHR